jgi:hypothetical protein
MAFNLYVFGGSSEARRLVAESGAYGNLVTALRTAAAQDRGSSLGLHAAQKAMGLGAVAAVGLKRTLGHGTLFSCVSELELLELGCGSEHLYDSSPEDWIPSQSRSNATVSKYTSVCDFFRLLRSHRRGAALRIDASCVPLLKRITPGFAQRKAMQDTPRKSRSQ